MHQRRSPRMLMVRFYMHTLAQWSQPHHRPLGDFANVSRALALVNERPAVSHMLKVNGLA